jgi:hypothetical protein
MTRASSALLRALAAALVAALAARGAAASPIWQPPGGTAAGAMQSAVPGPTGGPLQKLWTITMRMNGYQSQPTLVGISATGLSVILATPSPASRGGGGGYAITVYQNALQLWPQPQPLQVFGCSQTKGICNISVAFDDSFIYVASSFQQQNDPPQPPSTPQSSLQVFNISSGDSINPNLSPFPSVVLSVLANAADAPGGAALLWVVGNTSAFAGTYSASSQALVGPTSNLPVSIVECTLAHLSFAVCLLGGVGGMAVLRADAAGLVGPAVAWDDFVKPLFVAKDIGTSGALIVDTDFGGFPGGTLMACDLATGAALWTWRKPTDAVMSAFAYSGAGVLMLKSFFDDGAQFSVRFDTFALNSTMMVLTASASAPTFPPSALPFEDLLTLDGAAVSAYTLDSDGGSVVAVAVKVGVSGAGAISTLLSDGALQAPTALVAGPKPTQLSVQYDAFTVAVYM